MHYLTINHGLLSDTKTKKSSYFNLQDINNKDFAAK